jgi:hypothetical protein
MAARKATRIGETTFGHPFRDPRGKVTQDGTHEFKFIVRNGDIIHAIRADTLPAARRERNRLMKIARDELASLV